MFVVFASLEFIAAIAVLSSADAFYSTPCHGIATQCKGPSKAQIEMYKKTLIEGGCSRYSTLAEKQRFADCAMKNNPQLFKNISDLTANNQPCRDETGLKFDQPGIIGDCEVYGTPLADCLVRCSTCIRLPKFGFDSTEVAIQTFAACPLVKSSSYGPST